MFFGDENGILKLIDCQTGKILKWFKKIHASDIKCLAITRDQKFLYVSDLNGFVTVWFVGKIPWSTRFCLKSSDLGRLQKNIKAMVLV